MSRKNEIDEPIGDQGRRAFIKDVVLAGGATAMAAAAGGALAAAPVEKDPEASSNAPDTGYRVTPHVRAYYDKARF